MLAQTQFLPPDQRDPKQLEAARAACTRYLTQLEGALGGDWLVGSTFTVADLHVASVVNLAVRAGMPVGPRVTSWLTRCTERPAFKKVYAG